MAIAVKCREIEHSSLRATNFQQPDLPDRL